MKNGLIILFVAAAAALQLGCISSSLRFPSSTDEIYTFNQLKQSLLLAAQNNVLFHIPQETLFESEKTEIDSRCKDTQKPFWSEKLSVYLNLMKSNPEWFTKFHVIEIKKGDSPKAILENDLDGATVLSIQYGKVESRGKVTLKTNMPCASARMAEYLDKDIIKTQFDFPPTATVRQLLSQASNRKTVKRFEFSNRFISYLAERGFILKFSHELSFEKNTQNKYVFAEVLNKLSKEVLRKKSNKHVNLWMKILNDIRKTDDIIQMFSLENQPELKSGVKFAVNEANRSDEAYPYLFMSYMVNEETIKQTTISDLNACLADIPNQNTKLFLRQPTSMTLTENKNIKDYSCQATGKIAEDTSIEEN